MTVSLVIGIRNLLPEFLADALIFFCAFQSAGTVAAGALQTVFDHLHHFLIFVEPNCHKSALPFPFLFSIPWVSTDDHWISGSPLVSGYRYVTAKRYPSSAGGSYPSPPHSCGMFRHRTLGPVNTPSLRNGSRKTSERDLTAFLPRR